MLTHLFQTQIGQAPGMVSSCRRIHLIGAGGNGAPMLMRLHKMHSTLLALGEQGLDVTVWDMDTVSRFNLGRQPFYPADIGRNKAQLLVDRLKSIDPSIAGWRYKARPFHDKVLLEHDTLMVITCVDNKAARRCVHKATIDANRSLYWLDLGNEADTGQIVLGECRWQNRALRLPVVTELFPQILDDTVPEDDAPSCSTEEAITKQGLFVNEIVVGHAAAMIWEGIYKGVITHPIAFVNTKGQAVQGIGINRDFYKRRGFKTGRAKNPFVVDL